MELVKGCGVTLKDAVKNKALETVAIIWLCLADTKSTESLSKIWETHNLVSNAALCDLGNKKLINFIKRLDPISKRDYLDIYYKSYMQGYMSNNTCYHVNTHDALFDKNNPLTALSPDYVPEYNEDLRTLRILLQGSPIDMTDTSNVKKDETLEYYFKQMLCNSNEIVKTMNSDDYNLGYYTYCLMYYTSKLFGFADTIYNDKFRLITNGETVFVYTKNDNYLEYAKECHKLLPDSNLDDYKKYNQLCAIVFNSEKDNFETLAVKIVTSLIPLKVKFGIKELSSIMDCACSLYRLKNNVLDDYDLVYAVSRAINIYNKN